MIQQDIGILTFWGVPNHGTFAQAYALQNELSLLAPARQVSQIAHLDDVHRRTYFDPLSFRAPVRRLLKRLSPQGMKQANYLRRWEKITQENYNAIPHFALDSGFSGLNTLVLGSDIIWDYSIRFFNADKKLFGLGLNAEKRISYAASFGSVRQDSTPPEYVVEGILNLDAISVRDKKSADIVEMITGTRPVVVLDPVWLWDFSNDSHVVEAPSNNFDFVYGDDFTDEQKAQAQENARRGGRLLIGSGDPNALTGWCDVVLDESRINSLQVLGYFKKADNIITSTFHGTMFGFLFGKPVAYTGNNFVSAKLDDLFRDIGVYDLYHRDASIAEMLEFQWNTPRAREYFEKKKANSFVFLKKALSVQ